MLFDFGQAGGVLDFCIVAEFLQLTFQCVSTVFELLEFVFGFAEICLQRLSFLLALLRSL